MAPIYRIVYRPTDLQRDDADRQTKGLLGLALVLLLVVASLFLVRHLRSSSALEDCQLSGRSNCDVLVSAHY